MHGFESIFVSKQIYFSIQFFHDPLSMPQVRTTEKNTKETNTLWMSTGESHTIEDIPVISLDAYVDLSTLHIAGLATLEAGIVSMQGLQPINALCRVPQLRSTLQNTTRLSLVLLLKFFYLLILHSVWSAEKMTEVDCLYTGSLPHIPTTAREYQAEARRPELNAHVPTEWQGLMYLSTASQDAQQQEDGCEEEVGLEQGTPIRDMIVPSGCLATTAPEVCPCAFSV